MEKSEIKKYLEKGYFYVNIIFEIIGNPKEHINKAIKMVIQRIKDEGAITFVKEEFGEPEETVDGLWGVYCETELLIPDLYTLTSLAFLYSPASIEILEPAKLTLKDKELTDVMGDMLSHLHDLNTKHIELNSMNKALQKNVNALVRNAILLALNKKELTSYEIGKMIGVAGKGIEPVLDAMIKEEKLEKDKSKYKIK